MSDGCERPVGPARAGLTAEETKEFNETLALTLDQVTDAQFARFLHLNGKHLEALKLANEK